MKSVRALIFKKYFSRRTKKIPYKGLDQVSFELKTMLQERTKKDRKILPHLSTEHRRL